MQISKGLLLLMASLLVKCAVAQTTYYSPGSQAYVLLERLEIMEQRNPELNFSAIKPFGRKTAGFIYDSAADLQNRGLLNLSKVDQYLLQQMQAGNAEWVKPNAAAIAKRPILKTFYKNPVNFFEVNTKDFYLAVNPVLQLKVGKDDALSDRLFLNSRGIELRGRIAKRVGFYTYFTENQERYPAYVKAWERKNTAIPSAGYWLEGDAGAVDYQDARGYVTFDATRYINIQFGYDRNWLGNGERSMFWSDFAQNQLFLKLNTRIWKLNYQNIFMELFPQYKRGADRLLDRKYAAIHHLSMNITPWLNVGLFEGVMFGRPNRFDFSYLNPIIFLTTVQKNNGSPDNSVIGFDAKANVAKRVQLYTQFMLDDMKINELRNKTKWWGNKWSLQLGGKYINAFGVNNLDVQLEGNLIRPFTYTHNDSMANFTHYNQPVAHPMGANLAEGIFSVRYMPIPKLTVEAKLFYTMQGLDSLGRNFGSNLLLNNTTRPREYGFDIGSGNKTSVANAWFYAGYELFPNFWIEGHLQHRSQKSITFPNTPEQKSLIMNAGIRWNMNRRNFFF